MLTSPAVGIFGPRRPPDTCETCQKALARADESVRQVKQLALDFEELLDKVTRASARMRKREERDTEAGAAVNQGSGDNPGGSDNPAVARILARRARFRERIPNGLPS